MLHEHTSIGRDDSLRRSVVWVSGNLDVGKANRFGLGKYEAQRSLGITEALLPRHDPIANMSKTVRRQRGGPRLPPKANTPAELTVPQPAPEAGYAFGCRTIRKGNGRPFALAIFHACQKRRWIGLNARELPANGLNATFIVRRPTALKRSDIARKVFAAGADKFHGGLRRLDLMAVGAW